MSDSGGQEPAHDKSRGQQASTDELPALEGEIEGQVDEAIAKQVEDGPLDEGSIDKAGEAARAAQKANLQAAKTDDPAERKRLLTEAASHKKTVQTLQSGALQGAAVGGGIGLATGTGLGTVVGTVVGGVRFSSSSSPNPPILPLFTTLPGWRFVNMASTLRGIDCGIGGLRTDYCCWGWRWGGRGGY
ncbi:unnamed protein product [Discula destructiva]